MPPATVYGVATFYAQFSLEPKGKYLIKCCDGTACHVRKNQPIIIGDQDDDSVLPDGSKTTSDHRFTFEVVSCIGACALAPAVVIDGKVHGQMTPESVVARRSTNSTRRTRRRQRNDTCDQNSAHQPNSTNSSCKAIAAVESCASRVLVCGGTGCMANGSPAVLEAIRMALEDHGVPVPRGYHVR